MSAKIDESVSPILSAVDLLQVMEQFPSVLNALLGNVIIKAMYGYGCHLHPELCYLPVQVGTSWLQRFIRESLQQQIVVPCQSDFIFIIQDGELEVEFCHEGHVHISGTNPILVAEFLQSPAFAFIGKAGASQA